MNCECAFHCGSAVALLPFSLNARCFSVSLRLNAPLSSSVKFLLAISSSRDTTSIFNFKYQVPYILRRIRFKSLPMQIAQ